MKQLFCTISLLVILISASFGQKSKTYNYDEKWESVEILLKDELPSKAEKLVDEIYKQAKLEQQHGHFLKSVIFKVGIMSSFSQVSKAGLMSTISQVSIEDEITFLDQEIESASDPQKQILYSAKAQILWSYYEVNQYSFLKRTTTVKYKNEDISTWDLRTLIEEVFKAYKASLTNDVLLKNTPLTPFDQIISKNESREYRPTLYDLLAHRAIDFFMGDEPDIARPSATFYLNNPKYMADAQTFVTVPLSTPDSMSMKYYALDLLQKVIRSHLNDTNATALIDVDLKRLEFVKSNGIFENTDSLYLASLLQMYNVHRNSPMLPTICSKLALYYKESGDDYDSIINPKVRFDYNESIKYCDQGNEISPYSIAGYNCQQIKRLIEKKELKTEGESTVVPNTNSRILVEYRNIRTLYTRIIPLKDEKKKILTNNYSKEYLIDELVNFNYIAQVADTLPFANDYQLRSVEMKIRPLPIGDYILLISDNEDFSFKNNPISYVPLRVSNLSYIHRTLSDGSIDLAVFDRTRGKPVKDAIVEVQKHTYNYSDKKEEVYLFGKGVTNKDGHYLIPSRIKYEDGSFSLKIVTKDDSIESESNIPQNYRHVGALKENKNETYFFTDRSIYRPGQTVYFKGIMIETNGDEINLMTKEATTVKLYGADWKEKSSLNLITNEFGSFHGSFVLPMGGMTGNLTINNEFGSKYITVEEYKRPKFETTFKPIKGSYRLNDKVTVVGVAKAYAGNPIDGATVKYRVTRNASYPWWRWWWGNQPSSGKMEILNGETVTNEKGEYTITFDAIPDFNDNKQFLPLYNYSISADISDINGETHSANTTIPVSSISMFAFVSIPENIDQTMESKKYDIRTTNLNYHPEPASVEVKVSRLIQPTSYYNRRLWKRPTTYMYSAEEFAKLFPNDEYSNELDKNSWKKGFVVYQKIHNTASDTILQFEDMNTWNPGNYLIEIKGVDKYGNPFETSKNFTVTNSTKNVNSDYTGLSVRVDKVISKPGSVGKITIASCHNDASVYLEFIKEGQIIHKEWVILDENIKTVNFKIHRSHYGDIQIKALLVKNNRTYVASSYMYVYKKNEFLKTKFATFRNKLQPGENEEWRLTIKGHNGGPVAAELLATMYDASLDAFKPHNWNFWPFRYKPNHLTDWNGTAFIHKNFGNDLFLGKEIFPLANIVYEELNLFGFNTSRNKGARMSGYSTGFFGHGYMGPVRGNRTDGTVTYIDGVKVSGTSSLPKCAIQEIAMITGGIPGKYGDVSGGILNISSSEDAMPIQIRSNFNETAFFMPQLATDNDGNVVIKFKVPESLTRWKIMGLAHTKDLRISQFEKELVTQKELMVVPNQPRFFRESDQMEFNAKISNISDKDLNGIAKIEFFDALTMKPINRELGLTALEIPFSALKGQSTSVAWKISIPQGLMAITYRVTAQAGNFSDGEEMTLPVLTNRMLVTESLPLPINGNQTKTFSFDKLKNNTSTTLKNFKYTLEFTSNPAWYAIQALPYLMEYPYECSEQTFNRFYANSIATHIANSSPKIKAVFESWKINSPEALMSNLEKNQELKSLMLEETPWVLDAKNETEQKKRIGLLFDLINMSNQLDATLKKLIKMQTSNGGWSWFPGMTESEYITKYIVSGFGHLKNLKINNFASDSQIQNMIVNAVAFTDNQINKQYEQLKDQKVDMSLDHIWMDQAQYLYARTFFWDDIPISSNNKEAIHYYLNQSKQYWQKKGEYMQAMIAIVNFKTGDQETAKKIMASIKDRALYSEEMGMYWRNEGRGYFWFEAPIERQALLIEAFDLITNDQESVEKMKIWMLKQKQTQNWGTTKSTAEACYALLLKGTSQLTDDQLVEIKIGDKVIDPKKMDNVKVEAGTGYFKTAWNGTEITPDMGNITVTKSTAGVAWGSVYWQYFENLDKITPAATPLSMKKELFIVLATPTGEVIEPVRAGDKIKVGDKIRVRIVLRSDRDMEYVHMKDMRASAFEPINVLSKYKYQDGLGYYESTRDAATNFFFDYLRKGTYVFEYSLFATQKGDFSNGITTIQCMYAPEFTSHSEGIRVVVE